jgi:hypothetical protein
VADDSLISDDLVRQLVAIGHVDVLVGVPTLNHGRSIGEVVKAVHASFLTYFPRQRTVLFNSDGGSTDDTASIVRDCRVDDTDTVTASHALRTTHRISTPYHGLDGKGHAVRLIFSAADLLQAGAVVILDPEIGGLTPESVAALAQPVRDNRVDFVAPFYRRPPADKLLGTQLMRPLVRAAYGWQVREPMVGEFGCSGRFAAHCVEHLRWNTEVVQNGINLWMTGTALSGGFTACQTQLGIRQVAPGGHRPAVQDLFAQMVNAAFAMIDEHAGYCLTRTGSAQVPTLDPRIATGPVAPRPSPDGARFLESFAADVHNLEEILRRILTPQTLAAVTAAADVGLPQARFPDALWALTVSEFLVAFHHNVMRRDHIIQALLPLYMARAGSFLLEHGRATPEALDTALESLCMHFEQAKTHVVDRWTQPAVR